jgi:hypothetical protein
VTDVILAPSMRIGMTFRSDYPEYSGYTIVTIDRQIEGMRIDGLFVMDGVSEQAKRIALRNQYKTRGSV